jgi:hypothetical protein
MLLYGHNRHRIARKMLEVSLSHSNGAATHHLYMSQSSSKGQLITPRSPQHILTWTTETLLLLSHFSLPGYTLSLNSSLLLLCHHLPFQLRHIGVYPLYGCL